MTGRSAEACRVSARSAVDHPLLRLGVACPLRLELCVVDLAEIVGAELEVCRGDVLLETMELRRARDRHDPGLLCQEPGERDLGGSRVVALGDPAEQLDECLVGL